MAEENRRLLEEAAKRADADRERRDAVIREIRALESTPVDRTKEFDPTEVNGEGYLGEMSYLELQERLAVLKSRAAREEDDRRRRIAREKEAADLSLRAKVETIARARAESSTVASSQQRFKATLRSTKSTKAGEIEALRSRLATSRLQANTVRATLKGNV